METQEEESVREEAGPGRSLDKGAFQGVKRFSHCGLWSGQTDDKGKFTVSLLI